MHAWIILQFTLPGKARQTFADFSIHPMSLSPKIFRINTYYTISYHRADRETQVDTRVISYLICISHKSKYLNNEVWKQKIYKKSYFTILKVFIHCVNTCMCLARRYFLPFLCFRVRPFCVLLYILYHQFFVWLQPKTFKNINIFQNPKPRIKLNNRGVDYTLEKAEDMQIIAYQVSKFMYLESHWTRAYHI